MDRMTKIKLCGLKRPEEITWVNELRPDFVGFVFAPKSRRAVTPEEAERLRRRLAPGILPVGVFVEEEPKAVAELLRAGVIELAQLHGKESERYLRELRKLTPALLIKAFSVNTQQELREAEESSADYILLDSGPGGTGNVFDWSLLSALKRPCFLAGGLTPENVGEAVRLCRPYAVDVSSGIETEGRKDQEKMEAFCRAVRLADQTASGKGERV